jgi:hypothetical protein
MFRSKLPASEITPKEVFLSRRDFMKAAGIVGAGALLAACAPGVTVNITPGAPLADTPTSLDDIMNYNNYYEFSTDKQAVASLSKNFKTRPWDVEVTGLVNNPKTYAIEDLLKKFPSEERVYRLRCVEAWSMVIPWMGFPLAKLLSEAAPTSDAKFVRFEALPGGTAPRRGHARSDSPRHRPVRGTAPQPERRAAATRCPVEIWIQIHQGYRQDRVDRYPARHAVVHGLAQRIRFLLQRQPKHPAPALVAGQRTPHRRVVPPPDLDVQRLRIRSGAPV